MFQHIYKRLHSACGQPCTYVHTESMKRRADDGRTIHVYMHILYTYHHYIKILVVRVCVTGGQRKRFDLETQGAVSLAVERKKLDIGMYCERLSRHELHCKK